MMSPKVFVDTDYIGDLESIIGDLEEINAQLLKVCKLALKELPRPNVYKALETAISEAERRLE